MELTDYQKALLQVWLAARETMLLESWIAGAPLGESWLDTHARDGRGSSKRMVYVRMDHETAKAVPQCAGHSADRIAALLKGDGLPVANPLSAQRRAESLEQLVAELRTALRALVESQADGYAPPDDDPRMQAARAVLSKTGEG